MDRITKVTDALVNSEWTATIPFMCVPFMDYMAGNPLPSPVLLDICAYLGGGSPNPLVTRLYLNPIDYNSPPKDGDDVNKNIHYNDLRIDILARAFEAGSPLTANGGSKTERVFRCSIRYRLYKKRDDEKFGDLTASSYRQDSMINSRSRGSRENGRSLSRRTRTTQATSREDICPFRFAVKWDDYGFYIPVTRSNGCANHRKHLSDGLNRRTIPLKLVPDHEKETLRDMCEAAVGGGVGRNYVFSKLGQYITKSQISYLNSPENHDLVGGLKNSDVDNMIAFFEQSKEVSYHVLWDVPVPVEGNSPMRRALVSSLHNAGVEGHQEIDHSEDEEFQPARDMANMTRENPAVSPNARVMIACAFETNQATHNFKLFPEVIHADVTSDTNNTGNHMLTFTCNTSEAKQVIFLKVWLPNQKKSSFRWVFKFVLTSMIPMECFQRTRLVMVDGDQQQRDQLVAAMLEYMPHAIDGTCGWHLINQGLIKRSVAKGFISDPIKQEKYRLFLDHIKAWCYSWMTPFGCEDEEEYFLSKELLFSYINSREGYFACDGSARAQNALDDWVRNHVIIKEKLYLYYPKKNRRYFDVKTSSAHEGTNHGLKAHAAAVRPNQTMAHAARNACLQSSMKGCEQQARSTYLCITESLWSSSPTANLIVTRAESILCRRFKKIADFDVTRVAHDRFQVVYTKESEIPAEERVRLSSFPVSKTPVPCFRRVRTVTMLPDGSLTCDCGTQERQGLCCCETMAVIHKYFPDWKGPTHYEVSPRWWNYWLKFGHRVGCAQFTSDTEKLLSREKAGPSFPHPIPDELYYEAETPKLSARERVRNYPSDTLDKLVPRPTVHASTHGIHTTEVVDGLTQDSFIAHDSSRFEGGDSDGIFNGDDDSESLEDPLLSQTLQVQIAKKGGNARNRLQPFLDELYACLDRLNDSNEIENIGKVVEGEVGRLRLIIANSTQKRKNQVENVRTVNVSVESRSGGPKRIHGTRFTPQYKKQKN